MGGWRGRIGSVPKLQEILRIREKKVAERIQGIRTKVMWHPGAGMQGGR